MSKKKVEEKTDEAQIKEAVVDAGEEQEDDFPDDSEGDDDEVEKTKEPEKLDKEELVDAVPEDPVDYSQLTREGRINQLKQALAEEEAEAQQEDFMKNAPAKIAELEKVILEMGKDIVQIGKGINRDRSYMIGLTKKIEALKGVSK